MTSSKTITITLNHELTNCNLARIAIHDKGIKAEKTVKFTELIKELLVSHQLIQRQKYNQYIIFNDENIIAMSTNDDSWRVLYYYPGAIWDLVLYDKPIQVKLPSLIFEVCKDGEMKIFATKSTLDEAKNGNLKLFRFEFPNMLAENRLCFGTFSKKEVELSKIKQYIREVMMVPYTHNMPNNVLQDKETGIYEYVITGKELSSDNLIQIL